jgi:hypothetical protein
MYKKILYKKLQYKKLEGSYHQIKTEDDTIKVDSLISKSVKSELI